MSDLECLVAVGGVCRDMDAGSIPCVDVCARADAFARADVTAARCEQVTPGSDGGDLGGDTDEVPGTLWPVRSL